MLEIFRLAVEKYNLYMAQGLHVALFLGALIFLASAGKDKNKKILAGYSAVFFVLYFCPVSAKVIMDYCVGRDVYWRMFWLLPIPLVLAYAGTLAYRAQKNVFYKGVMLLVLVLVIGVTGYPAYASPSVLQKSENLQKVPAAAAAVCEIIRKDAGEEEYAKAAVPEDLVGYIRQYDAGIGLAYGRRGRKNKADKRIYAQMTAEKPNFRKMVRAVRRAKCNYLVFYDGDDNKRKIERQEYKEIGRTNGYVIYREQKST